jgi:uncharacterized protein
MYKIVLDTNILISAIVFGGKPRKILNSVIAGKIEFATSKDILEEVEGVLSGKKYKYPVQVVYEIRNAIEELGEIVLPKKSVNRIKKDPDDNRILECALYAKADFIISGDNHLLELKQFNGIQIVNPTEFLEKHFK